MKRAALLLFFFTASAAAQVTSVDRIGFTVSDADRAAAFFTEVLEFEKVSDVEVWGEPYETLTGVFGARIRVVTVRLGSETVELTEFLTPKGRPIPVDSRSNDRWFQHIAIVVSDIDRAYEKLRKARVEHVSTAPQTIPQTNRAAAGIRAFYFRDFDGHNLEIIWYPAGKGDPRWQQSNGRLFLGIDHTAIVVSNTDASLRFYRDLLGFRVAGDSENFGTEQEHLNLVRGAHLHISGLKAGGGPAVEFLDYLRPRDGRSGDFRPNDLAHWETTFVVDGVDGLAAKLRGGGVAVISEGVATMPAGTLGFAKGLLVRDPDGHAIRLIERTRR